MTGQMKETGMEEQQKTEGIPHLLDSKLIEVTCTDISQFNEGELDKLCDIIEDIDWSAFITSQFMEGIHKAAFEDGQSLSLEEHAELYKKIKNSIKTKTQDIIVKGKASDDYLSV